MRKLTTTMKALMLVAAFIWSATGATAQTLIISEVVDGTGSGGYPKYVEITNVGGASADLTGMKIRKSSNGGAFADAYTFGAVSLPAGESIVVANLDNATAGQLWTDFGLTAPTNVIHGATNINGNGDDAYAFTDGSDVIVDIYGAEADGTGLDWEYLDSYSYRNASVVTPNTTFDAAEWTLPGINVLDGQAADLSSFLTPGTHTFDSGSVDPEPTNHVTSFAAAEDDAFSITLTWADNDGAQAADAFLIKANTGAITPPVDLTEEADDTDLSDGAGAVNVAHGTETYSFTGLDAATTYNFEIYPYTNSGADIDFKTDGTVPSASATTMAGGTLGWYNLQWPHDSTTTVGAEYIVYAQAWEDGVTNAAGQGAGIEVWIGYSTDNTDPSTWTNWVPASYFGESGNNDEYTADLSTALTSAGTYYYASRFQFNGGDYMYGGTTGPWDGTGSISGVVNITWEPISLPYTRDFETGDLNTDGWTTQVVVGANDWYYKEFSGDHFAEMKNYYGGNTAAEAWFISPTIDLSGATTPLFSFNNACNYSGDDIAVYVSTDFAGDVTTATWDTLAPVLSTGGWSEVNSGDLDLTAYVGGDAYVAIKYLGTDSDGKTWQIDDITLVEAPLLQAPVIADIATTPEYPTSSDAISVSADVTDADGTVSTVTLNWGTESGTLGNSIAMIQTSKAYYETETDIPVQANGTTVYYEIVAEDNDAQTTTTEEMMVEVIDAATTTIPYNETFDADLGAAYPFSVLGDTKNWYHNGSDAAAKMNGYNSGEDEEDWLILPAVDLSAKANEVISFDSWMDYSFAEDATNYFKLMYSEDYAGTGDPSAATWNELTFVKPAADDTWTSSGDVDLSSINGASVYIAFKYYYDAGTYATWQVDNISIREYNPATQLVVTSVTPESPYVGQSFEVVVEAQDASGIASNVEQDTDLQLNLAVGTGAITGTTTGTITTGTSSFTFSGLAYDVVETIEVNISATAGMALTTTANESIVVNEVPAIPNVFISEYIEGSSNNKAVEIYNGTGAELDLTSFSLQKSSNGDGVWDNEAVLTGTLAAGEVFVAANDAADASILNLADAAYSYPSPIHYNGNDAVGLFYNGLLIDVIGVPDEDTIWTVAGVVEAAAEHTLVRKYPDVTIGNTDWAASAGTNADDSEWIVYDQNEFSYIGWHGTPPTEPVINNIVVTPEAPTSTDAVSISAVVTDDGTVDSVSLSWGLVSGTLDNVINMSLSSDDIYVTDTDIPAQADGTIVYYQIVAIDNDMSETMTSEMMYEVEDINIVTVPDIATLRGSAQDGTVYEITGEVIVTYQQAEGPRVFLQDATGGIMIYDSNDEITTVYDRYDGITGVTGTLTEFSELVELVPTEDAGAPTSTGNTITPETVTIADLLATVSDYESELILLESLTFEDAGGTFAAGTNYDLTNGTETLTFRTQFSEADYIGETIPSGPQNIVALVGNYNGTAQITSRDFADMTAAATDAPIVSNIVIDPVQPTTADEVNVTVTVVDADANLASVVLMWGEELVDNEITMQLVSGDTWETSSPIPAQDNLTEIHFTITATDDDSNEGSASSMYTVYDPYTGDLPFVEPFITSLNEMTGVNVSGDQDWYWDEYEGDTYARMSGYAGGAVANEDWLITPALDFSEVTNASLIFDEAFRYAGVADDELEVYVSADYDGAGDPSTATWTEMVITGRASGFDLNFVTVNEISLDDYAGEASVYVAFKYTSTDEIAATWLVDNIMIDGGVGIANTTVNNLSIYPNPAQNEVFVAGVENITNVQILSLDGKVVMSEQTNNNRIDVSSVNDGMYIMRVISGNEVYTTRFVKE